MYIIVVDATATSREILLHTLSKGIYTPSKFACITLLKGTHVGQVRPSNEAFSGRAFREHRTNVDVLTIFFIVRSSYLTSCRAG
jgi:hypothetical protein